MIINELNGNIINTKEVYIHDDVLLSLQFDRISKKLHLSLLKRNLEDEYSIEFINVVGFFMTSCDFWGASECILDFEYLEHNERTIIPKLLEIGSNVPDSVCGLSNDSHIETCITFSSGDKLVVACEHIIIT